MSSKTDRALLESLLKINNLNEFLAFREYLAATLEEYKTRLVHMADDRQVHNLQGRAQALKELIDLIGSAPAALDKTTGR
jgi:hypothetical protein